MIGIVFSLWAGCYGILFLDSARDFSIFKIFWLWDPPRFMYSVGGTRCSLDGVQRARHAVHHAPPSSAEVERVKL